MESIEEFDHRTKNGKEPGNSGGRPSKKFLEEKKAIEALQAIEKIAPGFTADFLTKFNGGSRERSKKNTKRTLEDLAGSPITQLLGPTVLGGAGIVAALIAWWQAENNIKDFPRILHLIQDLLQLLAIAVRGLESFTEALPGVIQETVDKVNDITGAIGVDVDAVDAALFAVAPPVFVAKKVKERFGF